MPSEESIPADIPSHSEEAESIVYNTPTAASCKVCVHSPRPPHSRKVCLRSSSKIPERDLARLDQTSYHSVKHCNLSRALSPAGANTSAARHEGPICVPQTVTGKAERQSLPGSPKWTDEMNCGHQPDGRFCAKMRAVFNSRIKSLLRISSTGELYIELLARLKRRTLAARLRATENIIMPKPGFSVGQQVRRRDRDDEWGYGFVTALTPLKVTVSGVDMNEDGFQWDEVDTIV